MNHGTRQALAVIGRKGGKATLKKYGADYFSKLSKSISKEERSRIGKLGAKARWKLTPKENK